MSGMKYRFDISANDFKLKVHFTTLEKSGLEWCKEYMSRFQRKVANVELKVAIYKRERKGLHKYDFAGIPFVHVKTLVKKPLVKKTKSKLPINENI